MKIAAAHGPEIVLGTEPADGSVLEASPEKVVIWFVTELDTGPSQLQVLDANGRPVDTAGAGVDLDDPEHASLVASLPALAHGTYTVHWRAAVFDDDDIVEGRFAFTVGIKQTDMSHDDHSHETASMASMSHGDRSGARTMMVAATLPAPVDTTPTQVSEHKTYRVSYSSAPDPIVINRIHNWVLHIEAADGQTVDDASVQVAGGMPEHNHGLPTAPKMTERLGNGDYLIEGLKFHMNGLWSVTFDIDTGTEHDSVTFNLQL